MKGRVLFLASALGFAAFGALVALGGGVVASCTSTQTVVTLQGVCNGTVTFDVASPGDGACIEPNNLSIPVTVEALNFALRPAGASCAYVCNCGFVELYLDGVFNNSSGTAVVDADLSKLGASLYGTHTLTARLVWDLNDGAGADLYDAGAGADAGADGGPTGSLIRTVTVTISPNCGGSSDAGPMVDGGDAGSGDAGPTDAGPTDAGPTDAGSGDAGSGDAGSGDAGPTDAGPADGGGDGGDGGDGG